MLRLHYHPIFHEPTAPMAKLWWEPDSDEAQQAPAIVATAWRLWAERLRDRPFVAGAALTLGDLGAAIATDYLARMGVEPPAPIAAWCARCFEVPAMAQARAAALAHVEPALARRAAARR